MEGFGKCAEPLCFWHHPLAGQRQKGAAVLLEVNLDRLEGHLWESANILRGPVDAADFKIYIFPLLFFKRICDVWDEEYQEIVADPGDAELALFPEAQRFQIPDGCHWSDVRAVATNVGNALQRAMREIEKANPEALYGVFGDAQWSNKERLSDGLLKDSPFFANEQPDWSFPNGPR